MYSVSLNLRLFQLLFIIFFETLAVDCGILTDPTNGQVMFTTTTYLSTADYTCDTGYNLVGVNQRTCTAAGTWSDGEPTCQSETGLTHV